MPLHHQMVRNSHRGRSDSHAVERDSRSCMPLPSAAVVSLLLFFSSLLFSSLSFLLFCLTFSFFHVGSIIITAMLASAVSSLCSTPLSVPAVSASSSRRDGNHTNTRPTSHHTS